MTLSRDRESYDVDFVSRDCQPMSNKEHKCYQFDDASDGQNLSPWMKERYPRMMQDYGFTVAVNGEKCYCNTNECNA